MLLKVWDKDDNEKIIQFCPVKARKFLDAPPPTYRGIRRIIEKLLTKGGAA